MSRVMLEDPCPALTDGVVALRRWTGEDLECVRAASEEGVIPEGTTVPERFTEESGRAWLSRQRERARSGKGWSLAVADARTNQALSCVVLMLRPRPGVAGVGYWLAPEARGRGYATRAVRLLTTWGLDSRGLYRVEAWVEPGNDASVQVLSRCGFEYEGQLRSLLQFPNRRADALVFSRIGGLDQRPVFPAAP